MRSSALPPYGAREIVVTPASANSAILSAMRSDRAEQRRGVDEVEGYGGGRAVVVAGQVLVLHRRPRPTP